MAPTVSVVVPNNRIDRRRKQFCIRGHDTYIVGRNKNGHCKVCNLESSRRDNAKPRTKARILAWARANPNKIKVAQLKHLYNLTQDRFTTLLEQQHFKCANPACNTVLNSETWIAKPQIDHDHSCCSGKRSCGRCVRGLLCNPCNIMLGAASDSVKILLGAIEYIQKRGTTKND